MIHIVLLSDFGDPACMSLFGSRLGPMNERSIIGNTSQHIKLKTNIKYIETLCNIYIYIDIYTH